MNSQVKWVMSLAIILCSSSTQTVMCHNCGDEIIRGVNLGGWFLWEPWIVPSIFEEVNVGELKNKVVDEWTYAKYIDKDVSKEKHERHWDTFYTEDDLFKFAAVGISHLRIPVGYWLVDVNEDEEPFPKPPQNDNEGQRFYLKRFLSWAENFDLKVIIDLHGAPGSQNGRDHSGRRGEIGWLEGLNVERTEIVLNKISKILHDWIEEGHIKKKTIYGIEVLNEPWGRVEEVWETCRDQFYPESYDVIRQIFPWSTLNSPRVIIQQALRNSSDFHGYFEDKDGVNLDNHIYYSFGQYWNEVAEREDKGWEEHLTAACAYKEEISQNTLPTFTGEFSLAVTECQKYIQGGYNDPYIPAYASEETCKYYDSDFSNYTEEYKDFLQKYFLAQIEPYQNYGGIGWFFWTGKTLNNCAPEWDFLFLVENSILPLDLCAKTNFCAA